MTPEALEIPLAINVAAVFVGALGGAIRAGEDEHVDIIGVLTLATVMGFGGSLIRDVLLGNLPPAVLQSRLVRGVRRGRRGDRGVLPLLPSQAGQGAVGARLAEHRPVRVRWA